MADTQAMTIIENLTEELGDKELRIMELEKQVSKLLKENRDMDNELIARKIYGNSDIKYTLEHGCLYELYEEIHKELTIRGYSPKSTMYKDMFIVMCRDVLEFDYFELVEPTEVRADFKSEITLEYYIECWRMEDDLEQADIDYNQCEFEDMLENLNQMTDWQYFKTEMRSEKGEVIYAKFMR